MADAVIDSLFVETLSERDLGAHVNAVAIILTWLPQQYWERMYARVTTILSSPLLEATRQDDIFKQMLLTPLMRAGRLTKEATLISLTHAFWQHGTLAQLQRLPCYIWETLQQLLHTERQLVCLFQLVCPFLSRFHAELTLTDVTLQLYIALATVDKEVDVFMYQDCVCDVLYHIKYMYTGDSMKAELEKIIFGLRASLQKRLRFITHESLAAIEKRAATRLA